MPFIPVPMPKPVCRTKLYDKIVQLEVCRTFSGRGMGINGTAQLQVYDVTLSTTSFYVTHGNKRIHHERCDGMLGSLLLEVLLCGTDIRVSMRAMMVLVVAMIRSTLIALTPVRICARCI